MNEQPEALRLADEYDENHWIVGSKQWCGEAATELRRLHDLNEDKTEIIAALSANNQELLEALKMIYWSSNNEIARAAIAKAQGESNE